MIYGFIMENKELVSISFIGTNSFWWKRPTGHQVYDSLLICLILECFSHIFEISRPEQLVAMSSKI